MALPHAETELLVLAAGCVCTGARTVRGWDLDRWDLDDDDVARAVATYTALLLGDTDPDADEILLDAGVTLDELLLDAPGRNDRITRADVVELVAAASAIAQDSWPSGTLHMPNVPKMARGKSDSGVDAMAADLQDSPPDDLGPDDVLYLASVKHTVKTTSADLRYKLLESVGPDELSTAYMAGQLRVFHGELLRAGVPRTTARRVYRFIRDWPDPMHVRILAVAAVAPAMAGDLNAQLNAHLPEVPPGLYRLRAVTIPDLPTLHSLCP